MSSSNRFGYFLVIAVLAFTGYFYFNPKRPAVAASIEAADDGSDEAKKLILSESDLKKNLVSADGELKIAKASETKLESPSEPAPQKIRKYFADSIRNMNQCLEFKATYSEEFAEPTLANLEESIRNEIGEVSVRTEDWSNTIVRLSSGEERRIRIETDLTGDSSVVRRLRYYSVNKDGLPVAIKLPKEQTEDPSEALVASLTGEGTLISEESSKRAYFQTGEELIYLERNGKVSEYELTKGTKTFKCMALEGEKASCKCF